MRIAGTNGCCTLGKPYTITRKVPYPETPIMVPFPSIIMTHPMIAADPNLPAFLTMRKNEVHAALQKFLLFNAIWMKAFLVINLTYLSRHHKTHLMQQRVALTKTLSLLAVSYYLAKYSKTTLIMVITAMMKEPKAMEPQ